MGRLAGVAMLAVATLVALLGLANVPGAAAAGKGGPLAEQSLLRLDELPAGYVFGETYLCKPAEPQPYGKKPGLEAWSKRYSPYGCSFQYIRLYRPAGAPPSPPDVVTASVTVRSDDAARAAIPVGAELVENLTLARRVAPVPTPLPTRIGDESRAYRSDQFYGGYEHGGKRGVSVLWRVGSTVEVVYAGGWSYAEDEQAAFALAAQQQAHVEAPTPYLAAEGNDIPTSKIRV